MSAPTAPICPLGLTPDDLSAWRDHALSPEDERRITAHASACPACQRTITAHDALAAALRADQPPAPNPRNWASLQARITANGRGAPSSVTTRRSARRPAIWGGLGAAVAVLLLSALFFRLFAQQADVRNGSKHDATPPPNATPQALQYVTPTAPSAGPKLSWQSRSAPESVVPPPGNQTDNSNIAFAPTDAQTAYICFTQYASHPSQVQVWATHDGARTWTHVSELPAISWGPDCIINVDAHDPLRVNIVDYGQSETSPNPAIVSAISDDGGKTWRTLSAQVGLTQLATRGDTSVAIADPLAFLYYNSKQTQRSHIVISHDGFHTWSTIDSPFTEQGQFVSGIWQRPGDGALLALIATQHALSQTTPTTPKMPPPPAHYYTWGLWTSADEGASWTRFPTPPNLTGYPGYLVAQPVGSAPWTVCGLSTPGGATSTAPREKELIGCTRDGGKTWVSLPLPALKDPCGANCQPQQDLLAPYESILLGDGTLVSRFVGPSTFDVYRLTPGATHWQDLGPAPGNALMMISSAPNATLVSYEGGSSADGTPSGSIVGHMGGDVPNRGVLSFATLP